MSKMNITIGGFFIPGGVAAAVLSSAVNHSFWWGLLHFFCSWYYVTYWLFAHTRLVPWLMSNP